MIWGLFVFTLPLLLCYCFMSLYIYLCFTPLILSRINIYSSVVESCPMCMRSGFLIELNTILYNYLLVVNNCFSLRLY